MRKKTACTVLALLFIANFSPAQDLPKEIQSQQEPPTALLPDAGPTTTEFEPQPGNSSVVNTGLTVYLVHPSFRTNPAYRVTTSSGSRTPDFDFGLDYAPSAWFELMLRDDVGLRVRYFQYAQATQERERFSSTGIVSLQTANPLGLGLTRLANTLASTENIWGQAKLSLMTWDFEATKHIPTDTCNWTLSFGGRYCFLDSRYEGYIGAPPPPPRPPVTTIVKSQTDSRHSICGGGPTMAVEFLRPMGCRGFSIYGSSRLAVVLGEMSQNARNETVSSTNGVRSTTINLAERSDFAVLTMGEFEIGEQCSYTLGRFTFISQVGFVANLWSNVGNASLSNSNLGQLDKQTLFLYGLAIRFGVNF